MAGIEAQEPNLVNKRWDLQKPETRRRMHQRRSNAETRSQTGTSSTQGKTTWRAHRLDALIDFTKIEIIHRVDVPNATDQEVNIAIDDSQ